MSTFCRINTLFFYLTLFNGVILLSPGLVYENTKMVSKHLKGHDTQQATVQSSGQRNRVNITLTGKEDLDRMEKQLRESAEYAEQVVCILFNLMFGSLFSFHLLCHVFHFIRIINLMNDQTPAFTNNSPQPSKPSSS